VTATNANHDAGHGSTTAPSSNSASMDRYHHKAPNPSNRLRCGPIEREGDDPLTVSDIGKLPMPSAFNGRNDSNISVGQTVSLAARWIQQPPRRAHPSPEWPGALPFPGSHRALVTWRQLALGWFRVSLAGSIFATRPAFS
jgi:hypothetical protein